MTAPSPKPNATTIASYPAITCLRLTEGHLSALQAQGSVSEEQHRGNPRYKLRFRMPGGRQIVRYIPGHLVECVRVDLDRLQSNRQASSALRESTRRVRQTRRDDKRKLRLVLDELGYHFHGSRIRRRRH
jgi:hypothetical protein